MSVIENPVAYLNETTNVEYDEQTPLAKQGNKAVPTSSTNVLDDTPLTTDKNKSKSPKQLNQTDTTTDKVPVSDLPDLSLSSQLGHNSELGVSESGSKAVDDKTDNDTCKKADSAKQETSEITEQSENNTSEQGTKGETGNAAGAVNFLALAEGLESEESEDEEYVPGVDHQEEEEEEEEKGEEEEEEITRLYSLRDGVKGTAVEEVKEVPHDESDKKKADDLWSAFKAEVAVPIKRKAKEFETTIKTYDFAGEAVTVKEEIRTKRRSIVSSLGLSRKRRRQSAPVLSGIEENEKEKEKEKEEPSASSQPPITTEVQSGTKRARPVSKLNSLVNRLTKRPKMTVLNKTALDWEKYKEENKISDDVKNEAKSEGYLEKQNFLSRADQKQFELEREIRAQQARRRQMMGSKQF